MRVLVQRVKRSSVTVNGQRISSISKGLNLLVGICKGDTEDKARNLAKKVANLRIFEDEKGKMNLSVKDVGGEVLVISQFTLCADLTKGRRPSFTNAEAPERARELIKTFINALESEGLDVYTGEFGAYMVVEIINDGPATFILEE